LTRNTSDGASDEVDEVLEDSKNVGRTFVADGWPPQFRT
jgi:hypothetical protein